MLNQPWADKSTTPMVLVHVHRFPNKQNHPNAICPNDINRPRIIHQTNPTVPHVIHPNETVGAVPACPPERPHSGVSMPKIHVLCAGDERRMRPCRATRAGTQAPPLPISVIHSRAIPPTTSTTHAQSTQTKRVNNLHTHRGRKCIAHSRPHYLK